MTSRRRTCRGDIPRGPLSRTAKLASLPLGAAGRATLGLGPASARRRPAGGHRRRPAAHRGAAVRGPGHAQGRRHEVRAGVVGLRGGHPRRICRAVSGGIDQAAERRPADADRHRSPRHGRATRPQLDESLRRVQRRGSSSGQHRPGAQGGVARRARRRGQDPVSGRSRRAQGRHGPTEPARSAARSAGARRADSAAAGRTAGQGHGGTGLRRRGRQPARLRQGLRR